MNETYEIVSAWRNILKAKGLRAQVFSSNDYMVFDFDNRRKIEDFQKEIKEAFRNKNIFVGIELVEDNPNQFAIKNTHNPIEIESFGLDAKIKNTSQTQEKEEVILVENKNEKIVIEKQTSPRPYNYLLNSAREKIEITIENREFNKEQKEWRKSQGKHKGRGIARIRKEPIVVKESITWEEFILKRGFTVNASKHQIYGHVIVFKTVADKNKFLSGLLLAQYKFARYENPLKISTHFEP